RTAKLRDDPDSWRSPGRFQLPAAEHTVSVRNPRIQPGTLSRVPGNTVPRGTGPPIPGLFPIAPAPSQDPGRGGTPPDTSIHFVFPWKTDKCRYNTPLDIDIPDPLEAELSEFPYRPVSLQPPTNRK